MKDNFELISPAPNRPDQEENESLGARLRARRLELGMGLRELARATGLSATFISNLERGTTNPTLATLRKIANALQTPLFMLLISASEAMPVVRHDQRRVLTWPQTHIRVELLVPDLQHKMVLFQVCATAEDGNLVGPPLRVPTEECIVVQQGRFRIRAYGQTFELDPGDSIYMAEGTLEAIHVVSEGEARFISAMTPPAF